MSDEKTESAAALAPLPPNPIDVASTPLVVPQGLIQACIDLLCLHPDKEKELGMARRFALVDQLRKTPSLEAYNREMALRKPSPPPPPAPNNSKKRN